MRYVQIPPERLGVVEIPAQVVFAEEEREILVRLPGAAVLRGHAQPAAVRGDVRVVIGKLVGHYPRPGGKRRQRQRVIAPAARHELSAGGTQPSEHLVEILIAKLDADEPVQREPTPEGHCLACPHDQIRFGRQIAALQVPRSAFPRCATMRPSPFATMRVSGRASSTPSQITFLRVLALAHQLPSQSLPLPALER